MALPLAACQTDGPLIPDPFAPTREELAAKKAELAAKDDATCRAYGAKPGTDIYVQCRMQQQHGRDMADAAEAGAPLPTIDNTVAPASYPPMPTRCQTQRVGMTMQTVCN
jgi:hypothetical protein